MVYSQDQLNKVVTEFIQRIRSRHALKRVYLYGSYVRGTARADSDIDLALVFDHLDESGVFDEAFEVFHEAQEFNPDIEPICFREDEFEAALVPIVNVIRKEGIQII